MSWDNITGEQKIIPTSGNANEVILESGKAKTVRLLLPNGMEPYSYFEHCIEVEIPGQNGQMEKQFRTVRCPKTAKNPNAPCPLCDGQQARRRVRHACNVWDIESNQVQKLNQGEDVFKPIATTRKLGVDILGVNWAILRTGEGRNDTEYSATNLGPSQFVLPDGTVLFDVESEYAPHSIDDMKAIVESIGANWNVLIVPPNLQYPATLQEALDHVMPNGKWKDKKMSEIWEADKTARGMINFLATKSDRVSPEKAAAQVILVNLGGANIDGVPRYNGSTPTSTPIKTETNPNTSAPSTAQNNSAQTALGTDRTAKVNKINSLFSTKEVFVKGGYDLIVKTLQKVSGGKTNIADFTDAELDALITECEKA